MSGLGSRAFRSVGFLGGRVMLDRFNKTSSRAVAANRATLTRILEQNEDTDFGRRNRFSELAADPTGTVYRDRVPLSTYADYAEDIDRMKNGETNVLVSDDLLFFAVSSGTTGANKLIPTTKKHQGFTFKYMGTVVQGVINRHFHKSGPSDRGVDLMTFSGGQQFSSGGVPIGGATAEAVRRMARIVPHLWNSPIEIYTLDDQPSAWYLHAIYGLRNRKNQFLEAVFAPHLLEWIRSLEHRWDDLINDIAHGTLTDQLEIEDDLRRRVLADNPPDPARADELRRATVEGFSGFLGRAWPDMTHLMTITSGSFATYMPALEAYAGDLPIYSPSYGATESFIGVGLSPDHPGQYVMATDPGYFEFIPIELADEEQPTTKDMETIEEGKVYELVVTNHAGLYRYRLGDAVRVVGRHGEAPIIEFLYRRGTLLDLVGEKTSEEHMATAVTELAERWSLGELVDFTTRVDSDSSPARYVVYAEVTGDDLSGHEADARELDRLVTSTNPTCEGFRQNNLLGPPTLAILRPGTFAQLKNLIANGDLPSSRSQLKVPRRIDSPGQVALLDAAVRAI